MLVTAAAPTPPGHRARLAQVLADFRIEGELLDWLAIQGNLSRYRFAMTGAKKLKRVQVLAPDIAEQMGLIHVGVAALADDGLIEFALQTGPYVANINTLTHPTRNVQDRTRDTL